MLPLEWRIFLQIGKELVMMWVRVTAFTLILQGVLCGIFSLLLRLGSDWTLLLVGGMGTGFAFLFWSWGSAEGVLLRVGLALFPFPAFILAYAFFGRFDFWFLVSAGYLLSWYVVVGGVLGTAFYWACRGVGRWRRRREERRAVVAARASSRFPYG